MIKQCWKYDGKWPRYPSEFMSVVACTCNLAPGGDANFKRKPDLVLLNKAKYQLVQQSGETT